MGAEVEICHGCDLAERFRSTLREVNSMPPAAAALDFQDAAVPLTDTEVHWAPCQGASVGGPESRCVNSASSCGRHDDAQEQGTATSVTHVWVCRTSSNGCRRLREIATWASSETRLRHRK